MITAFEMLLFSLFPKDILSITVQQGFGQDIMDPKEQPTLRLDLRSLRCFPNAMFLYFKIRNHFFDQMSN